MLLKAGTYRFNDDLNGFIVEQEPLIIDCPLTCIGVSYAGFVIPPIPNVFAFQYIDSEGIATNIYFSDALGSFNAGWQGDYQEHSITADTEVDDTFGTWYIANTNYNEVNSSTEDKEYIEKASWYTSVANAIRSKKGTTAPILRDDFASEISAISVGDNTPYYDGTVIIEKAESVLGLRRLKENYEPIITVEEGLTDEDLQNLVSNYGVTIEPMAIEDLGVTNGFVLFDLTDSEGVYSSAIFVLTDGTNIATAVDYSTFVSVIPQFNVLSTANSTVDEWLLANTEGVSV